jgi:hypothetical protein
MSEQISELELEFQSEVKGGGSLSPHVVDGAEQAYVGYDINPEDIEALFFDGIGVPRWASIVADSVDEQNAIYMERYNDIMAKFPMIGRANDTFEGTEYSAAEVANLLTECEAIKTATTDAKALRAMQKFSIAGAKAAEKQAALSLIPSRDQ